jgi:hypothetical protein
VWLTDARFNGVIVGPAGIQLLRDHHTLMVDTGGGGTNPSTGKLYTLPIERGGRPGPLRQLWESAATEAPDGFAVAKSGDVYISLVGPSGNAVVELSPSYHEIARVPANQVANSMLPVPFDAPGSVAFDGENVIVANQSAINNDPTHWALLEITVGERGLALSLPPAPKTSKRYRLRARPRVAEVGCVRRFRFTATVFVRGRRRPRPVRGARVHFAGHVARTGRHGHATIVAAPRHGRNRAVLTKSRHKLAVTTIKGSNVLAGCPEPVGGSNG